MKILVTGGAGFIGSHLVERLIALGHEVTIIDNLSSGKKESVHPKATFIEGDILEPLTVHRAIQDCAAVFHLAALADVGADPDKDYQTNFLGSHVVFERARKQNAKVIFASSAAVYGDAPLPQKEDMQCAPVSQYGKSKLKAERATPPQSFIVRIFNCYGPRGRGVVNTFCAKIPEYEDVTVYGHGLQTRDFVYVSDVVDALLLGLNNEGVYNVASGIETSLLNLIDVIHHAANATPHVKFAQPKQHEIMRSKGDNAKLRALGWTSKVGLEQGVHLTLQSLGYTMQEL